MKTLSEIRNGYLNQQNEQIKAEGYDEKWLLDIEDLAGSLEHTGNLMDLWLEEYPACNFDKDSFASIVNEGMWRLRKNEACMFFNNEEIMLDVSSCRWALGEAIKNRESNQSMVDAMNEYVENAYFRM